MDYLFLAAIWGGIITLAVLPLLCIMDIKTRQIPDKFILLYAILIAPAAIALYANGLPIYYAVTGIVLSIVWLAMRFFLIWGGADTKFLMMFSCFVPLNPLNIIQTNFQISALVWIGITMLATSLLYYWKREDVPMMVPISIGIVAAMIAGVFL